MDLTLDPGRPLPEEVRRAATACVDDALGHIARVERDDGDVEEPDVEEVVHETRKRCKETRGVARLVRPALGDAYHAVNAELRDAARELSSLRDAHALVETVEDLREWRTDEALDAVRGHLTVVADAATRRVDADDPRITVARARLELARTMIDAWDVEDDTTSFESGVARTYRRGRKAMAAVIDDPTDEGVHEWRKRVKYLWYQTRLLAPAEPEGIGPLVDDLDELSDLLGDDHDLTVLVAHVERAAGTDALVGVDTDRVVDLARTRQAELRAAALDLGRRVHDAEPDEFVERLAAPWRTVIGARTGTTVERERTFLVADMPELPDEGTRIRQGYLALDGDVTVRVREREGRAPTLTVKGGRGAARTELEWEMDGEQFDAAWRLTAGRRIDKTRFTVPLVGEDDLEAEVDVFDGPLAGLVLVEVEFDTDGAMRAFVPPAWFGIEVTDDDRYANAALAADGLEDDMVVPRTS